MGNSNLVLVDTEDLKEMIHEAVLDAVNECLPAAAIIPEDEKKYYTIMEVARKWGVCHQTIWRYAKEGRIKSAKVGRLVRFEKEYIDGLTYKIHRSGVISRPAASTSCRSFFITSAGIHFPSTLTVRTRLRLRTMSIGA